MHLSANWRSSVALRMKKVVFTPFSPLKNKELFMKMSVLSLLLTVSNLLMAHDSNSQDLDKVVVSIHLKNSTLKTVLHRIEVLTNYSFTYKTDDIAGYKNLSLDQDNISVASLLEKVLQNTSLKYEQVSSSIIIKKRKDYLHTATNLSVNAAPAAFVDTIHGRVVSENGEALAGVTIKVKNTTRVFTTDANGNFSFTVPDKNVSLIFSYTGYTSQELSANSDGSYSVVLRTTGNLNEVVVTGFGVKKEVRKLSYQVTAISGDDIAHTNTPNGVNALQGKVPGLYMSGVAGGPQTSSRILLRGISDLSPGANNQPLFVIDGVLIQPDITNTGAVYGNDQDFGNQLKNINYDDIESFSILNGSAGTALYGSAAQNGVILITTKKGLTRKGVGFSVTQQTSMEKPYGGADFQNEFGAGQNPAYFDSKNTSGTTIDNGDNAGASGLVSFGHKFDGTQVTDIDGRSVKWVAHPHNYLDVYRTGLTSNTNVALEGGNDQSTFRLSWSGLTSKGITPTNDFNRNTFALRSTHKFGKVLDVDAGVTYIFSNTNNPQAQNSSSRSIFNAFTYSVPRSYDAAYYKNHYTDSADGGLNLTESNKYGNAGNGYSLSYFLYKLYYWNNHLNENTLRANIDMTVHIQPWLNFLIRGNLFNTYSTQEQKYWGDGPGFAGVVGLSDDFSDQYQKDKFNNKSYRVQGLLTANHKLFGDVSGSLNVGGEIYNKGVDGEYAHITGLLVPGVFTLENYKNYQNTSFKQYKGNNYRNVSFYAFGDLGWKDQVYLNFSERMEYSSSLVFPSAKGNNIYQYPSVGLSWLLDRTFELPTYVNYFKLRGSFANTGKDILPWTISGDLNTYVANGSYQTLAGSTVNPYTFYSTQIVDPNLKPQRTAEWEAGLESRYLGNRLTFNATVFTKKTKEQIATKALDNSSGASSYYTNIGTVRNQGLELTLGGSPVKTKDFTWNTTLIYTKYTNKILSYATTQPYITLESQYFTEVRAYVGSAYGDIYSYNAFTPYQAYDASGKPTADANNGKRTIYNVGGYWRYMPIQYASSPYDNTKARKLGNINPNFLWSFSNTFNYKNWFANVLVDGRVGGKQLSFTYKYGTGIGALKSSLHGRDAAHGGVAYAGTDANGISGNWNDGIIMDGVFAQGQTANVNGSTVDLGGMSFKDAADKGYVQPVPASQYYYQAYGSWSRGIADLSTFDDSWVSLREVSIGYNLPKELTMKAKIQNLRLSLVGRNLFYIYNGMPAHVNPESIFNNRASSAFDFGAGPSTRSMGVSLNANF